jgi:hypothetical protein
MTVGEMGMGDDVVVWVGGMAGNVEDGLNGW